MIKLCSERLTVAGVGKEAGPSSINKELLQGLYMAPSSVNASLKTAILTYDLLTSVFNIVDE